YQTALLDWLACAAGGAGERTAREALAAGAGLLDRVTAAGVAGHILDYDDTYSPGVVHASACAAPAALVLGAELRTTVGAVLDAYSAGFEAAAALARASHPQLYERGWHPTAVCGTVGAATAAARLLGLEEAERDAAAALALLRAGGLRAVFGSDGKAVQVGMAAAAGVQAARLAAAGVGVPLGAAAEGFAQAFGGRWATADPDAPAIRENWIKPWPCCLFTHSTIDAVSRLGGRAGPVTVTVHPLARQAAAHDDAADGLQAKFSIPYVAAWTRLHGPPGLAAFSGADGEVRALAREVEVVTDPALGEWEARIDGIRVEYAPGSPQNPLDQATLSAKNHDLAGDRLDGILDDPARPAADVLAAGAI
ncbi:MAG TPA: MmgE/PrpD family protein, partial [Solirubrobacteraceae bacterium]|nr:MmgE/PrpD family protein [Solirubrobacteraceae bacterium]